MRRNHRRRRDPWRRLWFRLIFLLTLTAAAGAHVQGAFYRASAAEVAAGAPGTLIRTETIGGAPGRAHAYQVLYRSTGLHGEPIAVSGVVLCQPVSLQPAPDACRSAEKSCRVKLMLRHYNPSMRAFCAAAGRRLAWR
jgi:hypothetical protein